MNFAEINLVSPTFDPFFPTNPTPKKYIIIIIVKIMLFSKKKKFKRWKKTS